jgi:hypothetical protein
MTNILRTTTAAAAVLLLGATACGGDGGSRPTEAAAPVIDPGDGGDYHPDIDPTRFVDGVDNPYLPLVPGSRWVYEGTSEGQNERTEVVVTDDRRTIAGIDAVVVRDTVTRDGVLYEDTFDWYAQDVDGNVWYLGEATEEHEGGDVSTAGSWETGVDGALPGIAMHAHPEVGPGYRQEFLAGHAEDLAQVTSVGQRASVPAGAYDDVVVIEEWNPLEPDVVEEKSYAPGVGVVLEVQTAGGAERVELVSFTPGP